MTLPSNYNITEHRKFILKLQQKEKRTAARKIKISSLFFRLKDDNNSITFIYRPSELEANAAVYPTVINIRGTGYNALAPYYSYITCSHLAEKSLCQIIDINHRLAPEYPCPTGFNDTYSRIKCIIKNAKLLQIDLNNLAILGYSSGGNFAALAAIQAKKDNLPISLQILVSPITDLSRSLKSHLSFENQDTFPSWLAEWFINLYLSDPSEEVRRSPSISPYWADSNDLNHLPPTFFLFGEFDRFRSDSENYRNKLMKAGVWTHTSIFKKAAHSFFWYKIEAIDTITTQLRMSFNLFNIPRPINQQSIEKESKKIALLIKA